MLREPEFYAGASRCFRIASRQHKQANLTLRNICVKAPSYKKFSGCVYDGCTGKPLEDVNVVIRYGKNQCCDYTNMCGRFHFLLPCYVDTVSISLCKRGYCKRYIGVYPIRDEWNNNFRLYRI